MPIIDPNDKKKLSEYQAFTASGKNTHFIQDPRWSKVHDSLKAYFVTLEDGGKITAAATVYVRPIVMGYSLLYVNRGPIVTEHTPEILLRIINEMKPLVKKHKAFAVRFDPAWEYSDELTQTFTRAGFNVRGRGYTKRDLVMSRKTMSFSTEGKTMDELMKSFKTRTRRDINKSLRSELTIIEDHSKESLDVFMDILAVTGERDAITYKPREFFEKIFQNFSRDEARLYLIKKDDTWLSASVGMNYGGRMYYYHSGSTNQLRNLCPNAFMQYNLISWAVESGCSVYDMGGIIRKDPSDGLYLFKSGYCNDNFEEYIGELDYPLSKFKYKCFIWSYTAMQKYMGWKLKRRFKK